MGGSTWYLPCMYDVNTLHTRNNTRSMSLLRDKRWPLYSGVCCCYFCCFVVVCLSCLEVVSRDKVIIPCNILSWQCILLFSLVYFSMPRYFRNQTRTLPRIITITLADCCIEMINFINKKSSIERILWYDVPQCTPLVAYKKVFNCTYLPFHLPYEPQT